MASNGMPPYVPVWHFKELLIKCISRLHYVLINY